MTYMYMENHVQNTPANIETTGHTCTCIYINRTTPPLAANGYMYKPTLDVMKSPSAQDRFRPMPGLISCAGVTGSGCITYHAYVQL